MKPIRTVIATVFTLLVCLNAFGQTPENDPYWFGTDKIILRLPDNTQNVMIGQYPSDSEEWCYEWSGTGIEGDPNKPVIKVNPLNHTNVYHVRRTGRCGAEEGRVVVTVTDTVNIASVTAKTCYNNGDSVKKSDFDIVTDPAGFEDLVTLSPDRIYNEVGAVVDVGTITFRLKLNGNDVSKGVQVTIVNDNLTNSGAVSLPLKDLQNKLKEAKEMLMKAKKFSEFLDKLSGGWACGPPSLDFNLDINASQSTCYCCGGKVVDGFNVNLPLLSGSYSVDCAFPLPSLSIPCIGGLYVAGGGTFSISLGPMAMRFRGYCSQMDIPVDLGGEGVLGLQAAAVSKNFLSLSAKIAFGGKTGINWIIGKAIEWKGVEIYLNVVGEVKAIGLISSKLNIPLGSVVLFK